MEKTFNVILIIVLLVGLYYCVKTYNYNNNNVKVEKFDSIQTKIFNQPTIINQPIKFNYGHLRPIDKQFLKEQAYGVNANTWYANTWIDSIDENGEPIYDSRDNHSKTKETFIESKARFSYEFNSPRSVQMDGVADPTDFINGQARTIKEVYDNSFVDFKKLIPTKTVIGTNENINNTNAHLGASNLSFVNPDTWVYQDEKPENGGKFSNGIYASDPMTLGTVALYE